MTFNFSGDQKNLQITRVIYVVFSKRDEDVYREIVPQYFPPDPEHGK